MQAANLYNNEGIVVVWAVTFKKKRTIGTTILVCCIDNKAILQLNFANNFTVKQLFPYSVCTLCFISKAKPPQEERHNKASSK